MRGLMSDDEWAFFAPRAGPSSRWQVSASSSIPPPPCCSCADAKDDLNIRSAFLHMAGDALVSLGVVMGGALFLWQGWGLD